MIARPPVLVGGLQLAVAETVPPATPLDSGADKGRARSPACVAAACRGHRVGEGRLRSPHVGLPDRGVAACTLNLYGGTVGQASDLRTCRAAGDPVTFLIKVPAELYTRTRYSVIAGRHCWRAASSSQWQRRCRPWRCRWSARRGP